MGSCKKVLIIYCHTRNGYNLCRVVCVCVYTHVRTAFIFLPDEARNVFGLTAEEQNNRKPERRARLDEIRSVSVFVQNMTINCSAFGLRDVFFSFENNFLHRTLKLVILTQQGLCFSCKIVKFNFTRLNSPSQGFSEDIHLKTSGCLFSD